MSGQIELARLVDLSAERLGLRIEYDPAALKGAVTLRLGQAVGDDELWALTNRLIASRGFTSIQAPGSNVISIVKLSDAAGLTRTEEPGQAASDAGFVSVLVPIKHQSAKLVVEIVKPMLSKPGGAIVELGVGNYVLISDVRPRIEEVNSVIEMLDLPGTQPDIERVACHFVPAVQLVSLATAAAAAGDALSPLAHKGKLIADPDGDAIVLICPQSEVAFWKSLLEQFDQREPVLIQTYSPHSFAADEVGKLIEQAIHDSFRTSPSDRGAGDRWRLTVDQLTGTILVTATVQEHRRIAELMARLDSAPQETRRPLRIFQIRNRSVSEIVDIISRLLDAGVLESAAPSAEPITGNNQPNPGPAIAAAPPSSSPNTNATPQQSTKKSSLDGPGRPRAITLTADEGSNSLIVIADSRRLSQIEELIRSLDVRQPQVMIEVLVVNLSDSDALDLGVELKKVEINGSTLFSVSSLFGLGTSGKPDGGVADAGRGLTGLVLSPGDFSVVVRALQSINHGRTLTLPRVLVNNGQKATLDSVLQQPFVSLNASQTVATTSFGGSENAGTVITVKPQIAQGDHLVLEYSVALSAFVGQSTDPALPPPKQSNNLNSVITIPDGYTIVVGGLDITSQSNAVSQIPLVGDIPLLGEAFKNRAISKSHTRFFVFIRSNIMRHEGFEELKYRSARAVAEAAVDDEWPVVESRIIR